MASKKVESPVRLDPEELQLEVSRVTSAATEDCSAWVEAARNALGCVDEAFANESADALFVRATRLQSALHHGFSLLFTLAIHVGRLHGLAWVRRVRLPETD